MPPCAAIECARRGLSWKQKAFTLYPNSASEAAADAPAKPVPTTITSYLRLLAGLTSFKLNLCLLHFSANGPAGIFASKLIVFLLEPRIKSQESRLILLFYLWYTFLFVTY